MLLSQQKVTACIHNLAYDFNHFVLKDFVRYTAVRRGKSIMIRRMPLDPDLFGVWIPTRDVDYVFVNNTLHPTHQIHTVLHELAHILLDHPRRSVEQILPPVLLELLEVESAEGSYARTLLIEDTPEEQEAEDFVFQIQAKVIEANRLHELTAVGSSIETLLPLINTSAP